jgi:hypothetical protein
MELAKGKYGELAQELQKRFDADGVLVLVHKQGGDSGMSIAGTVQFHAGLPRVLSLIAADVIMSHDKNMTAIVNEMMKEEVEKN